MVDLTRVAQVDHIRFDNFFLSSEFTNKLVILYKCKKDERSLNKRHSEGEISSEERISTL